MNLKKQKGETNRHFESRKLFVPYLKIKKNNISNSIIENEFPKYGGRARADLALISKKPPIYIIHIWVEIQDSKLTREKWIKKLEKISKVFNPEELYVILTENLSRDILTVLDIVSNITDNYKLFLIDTKKELIYQIINNEKILFHKVKITENKIIKTNIKITLDDFW